MELSILPQSEYEKYGIDPSDVPTGMVVSLNTPPMLEGRYGGNVYGLGAYEAFSGTLRWLGVNEKDVGGKLSYSQLNSLYKRMGLLIRFTKDLKPYYLVPFQIASQFNVEVKFQLQRLSEIITNYKVNHYQQTIRIGIFTNETSVLFHELKARFVDDEVEYISQLTSPNPFDLLIFPEDYWIWFDRITPSEIRSDRKNHRYWIIYILHKIYRLLQEEGNLIFFHKTLLEDDKRRVNIKFQSDLEAKRFLIYSKVRNIEFSYVKAPEKIKLSLADLSRYLIDYHRLMELNIERFLTEGKSLSSVQVEEIELLHTSGYNFSDKAWVSQTEFLDKFMSIFFSLQHKEEIFSDEIKEFWERKFIVEEGWPRGFFSFVLFGVRPTRSRVQWYLKGLAEDQVLTGCRKELVADYRDSFEYVIKVLDTLSQLKHREYPQVLKQFSDRLRLPLESKKRRHRLLEDVLRLQKKRAILEELKNSVNFKNLEGPFSNIFSNLEMLCLMDFQESEIMELLRIVVGHSPFGRIILGKLHEKRLEPILEYAKRLDSDEGLNLFRYLRLMTACELEASLGKPLSASLMKELFELYDKCARYVSNPGPEVEYFTHEGDFISGQALKITVLKRLLKLMGYHDYLDSPDAMASRGDMELEVLAGFEEASLQKIKDVRQLVVKVESLMERFWEKGIGFEEFARRLMESEFHGTGRLFQLVPPNHGLSLLWILLGASKEKILNLNPVLKGLPPNEIAKKVTKIKKDLEAIDILGTSWAVIGELKEELYKRSEIFVPGTGFLLSLNSALGVLAVDYQDIREDIKKCSRYLERIGENGKASIEEINELDSLIKRLNVYQYSQKDIKNYPSRKILSSKDKALRYKFLDNLLLSGRKLVFETVLDPSNIYLNFRQIKDRYPRLLSHLLGVKEQHLLDRIVESFRMFQYMLIKDIKSFYNPEVLERRLQQEFGVGGSSEIGATEEEILLLSEELEGLSDREELLRGILLALVGLVKSSEEQFLQTVGFLTPEFCQALSNDFRDKALKIFEGAKVILGYTQGTHSLFQVEELRGLGTIFLASFIAAFIVSQACESKLISHDYLAKFLYPLLPIPPYQRPDPKDSKGYAFGRLFRLKGLMYVEPGDVEKYLRKAQPRYIMTMKGLRDVGLPNFERELYEGSRVYRAFFGLPEQFRAEILKFLERAVVKGFTKVSNFLTYENQFKLLGLLAIASTKIDSQWCIANLGSVRGSIDITYECINKELLNFSYDRILSGDLPSIFSLELFEDGPEIVLEFNPDIEISNVFKEFAQATDIQELKTKYTKILHRASEYYITIDRIEKILQKPYTDRLKAIIQEKLNIISRELAEIKDFSTLEKYKKKTIDSMLNRGVFVKEVIPDVDEVFERKANELRQAKIMEIRNELARIKDQDRLMEYWEETKAYLKTNKSILGQDYLLLVARLFDSTSAKLLNLAQKNNGSKFSS